MSRAVATLPSHVTSKRAIPKNTVAIGDRAADEQLADQHGEQNQIGAAPSMMIATMATMNSSAVDGRVELLAELADLAEPAGEVAVDPVGRAEPAEQPRRGRPGCRDRTAGTGTTAGRAAGAA